MIDLLLHQQSSYFFLLKCILDSLPPRLLAMGFKWHATIIFLPAINVL